MSWTMPALMPLTMPSRMPATMYSNMPSSARPSIQSRVSCSADCADPSDHRGRTPTTRLHIPITPQTHAQPHIASQLRSPCPARDTAPNTPSPASGYTPTDPRRHGMILLPLPATDATEELPPTDAAEDLPPYTRTPIRRVSTAATPLEAQLWAQLARGRRHTHPLSSTEGSEMALDVMRGRLDGVDGFDWFDGDGPPAYAVEDPFPRARAEPGRTVGWGVQTRTRVRGWLEKGRARRAVRWFAARGVDVTEGEM